MQNPSESEKVLVGKVKDAHNLKGEVYVKLFTKKPGWLQDLSGELWLGDKSGSESFSYHRIRPHKEGLLIHFDGYEDRTKAETLKGKDVLIPREFLTTEAQEGFYLIEILNFKVKLEGSLQEAEVVGFSDNSLQDLIQIKTPKGKFDVPLVDDFILHIDYQERTIDLKLPEGLVEWS